MLIEAGCDINALDKNKWTPLMNACYWANEDAALVLLKSGADPSIRNIVILNIKILLNITFLINNAYFEFEGWPCCFT